MTRLGPEEQAIVATVRDFVAGEVLPRVHDREHANEYPGALVQQMKALGIFG
jgi:alkylation response protein AidB-like acyl-CoA dehydrogenase